MASEIEICNMALSNLGQGPITNLLDPQTTEEQLCALHYPTIRDGVLEARAWTFAKFQVIRESTQADEWGLGVLYPIEADWLAVLRCYRSVSAFSLSQAAPKKNQANWEIQGSNIVADVGLLYIEGVLRITDTNKFSKLFVQTVAARLAAELCIPITNEKKLLKDMWDLYNYKLKDAASRDGGQGRSEIITAQNLIKSR